MKTIAHKFVRLIPDKVEEGVIYISLEYCTVVHKCCCGCGNEVVTPLSPMDWEIIFNGETISLYPSIGNWSFDCKSHYWIRNNRVKWARQWSEREIERERYQEYLERKDYYDKKQNNHDKKTISTNRPLSKKNQKNFFPWFNLKKWL